MATPIPTPDVAITDRPMSQDWYDYFREQTTGVALTVAGLPAAGVAGRRRFVTDATTATFGSIVVGGSGFAVPVYDDGTNWRIG